MRRFAIESIIVYLHLSIVYGLHNKYFTPQYAAQYEYNSRIFVATPNISIEPNKATLHNICPVMSAIAPIQLEY